MTAAPATASDLLRAADEEAAQEWLHANRCTDGLPVVVPTPERVEEMVLFSGLDADHSLGALGVIAGDATIRKLAANAVMAGCRPEHFAVVVAAVTAVCDPILDLIEADATTHNLAPLIIVNGPIRHGAQIESGTGALGPGHRANATIGRALRLCLINIGGSWPGKTDMALLGQPAKFTFCVAEDEEGSPFPPLHVSRGHEPGGSAVTVVFCEGPHSVIGPESTDTTGAPRLLRALAGAIANLGSNNTHSGLGTVVVVLNPAHARLLEVAGFDRRRIQEELHRLARTPRHVLQSASPSVAAPGGDADDLRAATPSPESILVVVAGGAGVYSAVMPSWGAGEHANQPVTVTVRPPEACEVPQRTY